MPKPEEPKKDHHSTEKLGYRVTDRKSLFWFLLFFFDFFLKWFTFFFSCLLYLFFLWYIDGAGKGNWGVATDPEVAPAAIDERDPNYVVCFLFFFFFFVCLFKMVHFFFCFCFWPCGRSRREGRREGQVSVNIVSALVYYKAVIAFFFLMRRSSLSSWRFFFSSFIHSSILKTQFTFI